MSFPRFLRLFVVMVFVFIVIGVVRPAVAQDADKPSLAVLGLVQTALLKAEVTSSIHQAMFEAFETTGRFVLIDRTAVDEQMASSAADAVWNGEKPAMLGKQLAAEKVVLAEIGKLGKTYLISVKLVDVNTGSIEHSETAEYKGKTKGLIEAVHDACKEIKVNDP